MMTFNQMTCITLKRCHQWPPSFLSKKDFIFKSTKETVLKGQLFWWTSGYTHICMCVFMCMCAETLSTLVSPTAIRLVDLLPVSPSTTKRRNGALTIFRGMLRFAWYRLREEVKGELAWISFSTEIRRCASSRGPCVNRKCAVRGDTARILTP